MKNIFRWFLVALVTSLSAEGQLMQRQTFQGRDMQPGKAIVRGVQNAGQCKATLDGVWVETKSGTVLKSGAEIKTATNSIADLFLSHNGPVIRLEPNTHLVLDKLEYVQTDNDTVITTMLTLKTGQIRGNVKKLAPGSRYSIQAPAVTCTIKGTEYLFSASGEFRVATGQAEVTYHSSSGELIKVIVPSGFMFLPPQAGQKTHTLVRF